MEVGQNLVKTVEAIDLVKQFDGLTAVDKVNMSVEKGELFGLLGPNGAGKTTTIKMLITLLKPTSGKALVAGFDVLTEADEVRRRIGYVPQESALDVRLTAAENLELFAELYGLPKSEIKPRINEVLELVDLDKRKNDLVAHYSGGMKRRLEISRGLLPTPQVLFLDEPTLGLDPQSRRVVWEFIHKLQKDWDLTILTTTHYLDEAEREMDRVAIIDKGTIMAMGRPEDLKTEFGKDVVELVIKSTDGGDSGEQLKSKLLSLELGTDLSVSDRKVRLGVPNGKTALPLIMHKIESVGLGVESISVRSPSLDDVFIKYTGRGIREDEGAQDSEDTKKQRAMMMARMRRRV
ncbi:MAG: ABC transporter ATP-binding protein [Candidatus Thorarchaeota archaeon]|nr:MAG: ABC transporter ATP-binding protein [Candidatus Thorarchaeota archaeon]